MFRTLLTRCILPAALITPITSQAHFYNEFICAFSAPTKLAPGESFTAAFNVGALRTTDSNIPVDFYYSQSPNVDSTSTYLGSSTVFLPQQGSQCSAIAHKTLRVPTKSKGLSCFIPNKSYIIAKTGDDEHSWQFQPRDGDKLPQITESTPSSGRPGSLIHVVGENIDTTTGIRLSSQQMSQALIGNELIGIVDNNSSTGAISLANNAHNYCVPPLSVGTQFTVQSAGQYCSSGAANQGFGRISQIAMSGFNNDLVAHTSCPEYTDTTANGLYGLTRAGTNPEALFFQLNACGAPAYDRMMKIFIDWNNDLDFDDAGETILEAPFVGVDTLYQLNLNIPSTAKAGTTRMRIISALYYSGTIDNLSDLNSCGFYPFGETQDYNIDIVPANFGLTAQLSATGKPLSQATIQTLIDTESGKSSVEKNSIPTPINQILVDGKPAVLEASGQRLR